MRLADKITARWWVVGVAVICGLALLAPALVNPRSARAATVVVDDFSTDQARITVFPDPDRALPTDLSSSVTGAGILGGERDIRVRTNVAEISNFNNGMWALVEDGLFESDRQSEVTGSYDIQWDGADGDPETLDHTGLDGIDLTGGTEDAFHLRVDYYNLGAPSATITVYTDASNASSYTVNFIFSSSPRDYIIEFSDFTTALGGGANFTDVGAITIFFNASTGSGPYFDFLQTTAIDDEPPVTTVSLDGTVGNNSWYTSPVQVTLNASDNLSGVDDTFWRLGSDPFQTYTGPFGVSVQGYNTLEFYSIDNEGNTEATKTTTFKIDTVAPTTTASLSGTEGDNGWYTGPVQVTLNRSDATSGISYTNYNAIGGGGVPYTGPFTLSDDGEYNVRFFSADQAGNFETFKSVTVKIDQTAPTITGSANPPADGNGWNNTDVTVSFECADGTEGSGPDSVTPDTTLTNEGTNQSVDGTCVDVAGHSASDTVNGINIDKTAPVISIDSVETADGQPFVPGPGIWTNQDVTVTFTCAETGAVQSGIDQNTIGNVTLSADGEGQTATNTGVCTDLAGNSATAASVPNINIDQTAPTITGVTDPPANANGWNNTPVTVSFECTDATGGSGVDESSVTPPASLTGEGANQSSGGNCSDLAGNSASTTVTGINIDMTAPIISVDSIQTADGQTFAPGVGVWTNQDVTVTFSCAETGTVQSGLDQNSVGNVTLDTDGASQAATNTGTCTDLAGNSASPASVPNINIDQTAPTVVTGGPYLVDEGSTVNLDGGGSTDGLSGIATIAWALDGDSQFDDADPASVAGLDGPATIPVSLQVTDLAGNVSTVDTTVTVNNVSPEILSVTNDGPPASGSTVNVTVDATDPAGLLDPLSYEFDCDNDLAYDVGPQSGNSAACDIGVQEGGIIVNVRVTDGDGGEALGSTVIAVPTEMCASRYTGILRYDDSGCRSYELSVVLTVDSPASICVNNYTGVLRYLERGACSPSETWMSLPDDGPLAVCVSTYTQVMRAVDDIAVCQPFEFGRIIGANGGGNPGASATR